MLLTVVVPTADRCSTLESTLRTVVQQDIDNLEIIVSDNASKDNTKEIVRSFTDPRIKYINPGKRIGMASNWEFALDFVSGDYLFYLGDDDALLPNACKNILELLKYTGSRAIVWEKPNYCWPDSYLTPNLLDLRLDQKYYWLRGDLVLRALASGLTSYGRLPNVYTSFVSTREINAIRRKAGAFFKSITPDVFSGIVLAHSIPRYVYSTRPFSINGGSSSSNGLSVHRPDDLSHLFFAEADLDINQLIPVIVGSVSSSVGESYLQAYDNQLTSRYKLNLKKYHRLIFNDLIHLGSMTRRREGFDILLQITQSPSLRRDIRREIQTLLDEDSSIDKPTTLDLQSAPLCHHRIKLDAGKFKISDAHAASSFVYSLIGDFTLPTRIKTVNIFNIFVSKIVRRLARFLDLLTIL